MKSPVQMEDLRLSAAPTAAAVSLPPTTFSNPAFFEFEFEAVWARQWVCIGRVSDIPNQGDYYTLRFGPEPLLIVRGPEGRVRVLSNVCRHRAMFVAEGRGNARLFRCPLHSWVYGLDGTLRSAPTLNRSDDFDRSSICLPEIRSDEWEGFLFINLAGNQPPLQERLDKLTMQVAPWAMSELRAPEPLQLDPYEWNWKVFGDECYHCAHLHSKTWQQGLSHPTRPCRPGVPTRRRGPRHHRVLPPGRRR